MAIAASKLGPQEMPPEGGYNPLEWKRVKLRTVFTPVLTIGLVVASTLIGMWGYTKSYYRAQRLEVEMRSAQFALLPMLIAERDRAFLKQVRINRDEETELMKNVPEWEVGTYFREPIYRTMSRPDKFNEPTYYEFMAHANYYDVTYRVLRRHIMP